MTYRATIVVRSRDAANFCADLAAVRQLLQRRRTQRRKGRKR
jgi:hypothetical protein